MHNSSTRSTSAHSLNSLTCSTASPPSSFSLYTTPSTGILPTIGSSITSSRETFPFTTIPPNSPSAMPETALDVIKEHVSRNQDPAINFPGLVTQILQSNPSSETTLSLMHLLQLFSDPLHLPKPHEQGLINKHPNSGQDANLHTQGQWPITNRDSLPALRATNNTLQDNLTSAYPMLNKLIGTTSTNIPGQPGLGTAASPTLPSLIPSPALTSSIPNQPDGFNDNVKAQLDHLLKSLSHNAFGQPSLSGESKPQHQFLSSLIPIGHNCGQNIVNRSDTVKPVNFNDSTSHDAPLPPYSQNGHQTAGSTIVQDRRPSLSNIQNMNVETGSKVIIHQTAGVDEHFFKALNRLKVDGSPEASTAMKNFKYFFQSNDSLDACMINDGSTDPNQSDSSVTTTTTLKTPDCRSAAELAVDEHFEKSLAAFRLPATGLNTRPEELSTVHDDTNLMQNAKASKDRKSTLKYQHSSLDYSHSYSTSLMPTVNSSCVSIGYDLTINPNKNPTQSVVDHSLPSSSSESGKSELQSGKSTAANSYKPKKSWLAQYDWREHRDEDNDGKGCGEEDVNMKLGRESREGSTAETVEMIDSSAFAEIHKEKTSTSSTNYNDTRKSTESFQVPTQGAQEEPLSRLKSAFVSATTFFSDSTSSSPQPMNDHPIPAMSQSPSIKSSGFFTGSTYSLDSSFNRSQSGASVKEQGFVITNTLVNKTSSDDQCRSPTGSSQEVDDCIQQGEGLRKRAASETSPWSTLKRSRSALASPSIEDQSGESHDQPMVSGEEASTSGLEAVKSSKLLKRSVEQSSCETSHPSSPPPPPPPYQSHPMKRPLLDIDNPDRFGSPPLGNRVPLRGRFYTPEPSGLKRTDSSVSQLPRSLSDNSALSCHCSRQCNRQHAASSTSNTTVVPSSHYPPQGLCHHGNLLL